MQNAILKRIEEAKPVAIMAKTHISHTMQMLFEFSERKGLIYTHMLPRGATINATYIVLILGKFLMHL